jgi:hypothetical protein
MSNDYYALVAELCRIHGIPNAEDLYDGGYISFAGVRFELIQAGAGDGLLLLCDFGKPPQYGRELILQRVLETNLFMLGTGTLFFSMDNESGHVLLADRLSPGISAAAFLEKLEHYAQCALAWQSNYFVFRVEWDGDPGSGLPNSASDPCMTFVPGSKKRLM